MAGRPDGATGNGDDAAAVHIDLSAVRHLPHGEQVEAYRSFIERAGARLAGGADRGFQASDPDGLVTAEVDGAGRVRAVRFAPAAAGTGAAVLQAAVLAAIEAAQQAQQEAAVAGLAAIRVDGAAT